MTERKPLAACSTYRIAAACLLLGPFVTGSPPAFATSVRILHSFQDDGSDGFWPEAGLVNFHGTLFGTTSHGGPSGDGTVFAINPVTGVETVVHAFGGKDGSEPVAALNNFGGTLYGTTRRGGRAGYGTIFTIDPATGTETVVYSFGEYGSGDGIGPAAGLLNVQGVLYGTTEYGGDPGSGTVYWFETSGGQGVAHWFPARQHDGLNPVAGLIYKQGWVFGTTKGGGKGCHSRGCGTVFRVLGLREHVVHEFADDGTDGVLHRPRYGRRNHPSCLSKRWSGRRRAHGSASGNRQQTVRHKRARR